MAQQLRKVTPKTFEKRFDAGPREKELPKFHIFKADLPKVKDWENGVKYNVTLVGKQVASDEHGVTLEIHKMNGDTAKNNRVSRRKRQY